MRRRLERARRGRSEGWFGGVPVRLERLGEGMRAGPRLDELLRAGPVRGVILVGLAGALTPTLHRGAVVSVERVVSLEGGEARELRALPVQVPNATAVSVRCWAKTPAEKATLAGSVAAKFAVVDLEGYDVATVARVRGVACAQLRVISDAADASLPEVLEGCQRADGSSDRVRLVLRALLHPRRICELRDLARIARDSMDSLAEVLSLSLRDLASQGGFAFDERRAGQ